MLYSKYRNLSQTKSITDFSVDLIWFVGQEFIGLTIAHKSKEGIFENWFFVNKYACTNFYKMEPALTTSYHVKKCF